MFHVLFAGTVLTRDPIIGANHGFIDKFSGDAIMILFDRDPDGGVGAAIAGNRTTVAEGRSNTMSIRQIKRTFVSVPTLEGAGVHLKRGFAYNEVPLFDPFLMLDDFHTSNPDEYLAGFPWHPHRATSALSGPRRRPPACAPGAQWYR